MHCRDKAGAGMLTVFHCLGKSLELRKPPQPHDEGRGIVPSNVKIF